MINPHANIIIANCSYTLCVGLLVSVPPQGCEAIVIEILCMLSSHELRTIQQINISYQLKQ